jgi:hypothetical protein
VVFKSPAVPAQGSQLIWDKGVLQWGQVSSVAPTESVSIAVSAATATKIPIHFFKIS